MSFFIEVDKSSTVRSQIVAGCIQTWCTMGNECSIENLTDTIGSTILLYVGLRKFEIGTKGNELLMYGGSQDSKDLKLIFLRTCIKLLSCFCWIILFHSLFVVYILVKISDVRNLCLKNSFFKFGMRGNLWVRGFSILLYFRHG